jgi:hypothetical protein
MQIAPKMTERLEAMVGSSYMYMGRHLKVRGYALESNRIKILTAKGNPVVIKLSNLDDDLDEFMPAESESNGAESMTLYKAQTTNMASIEQIVMANIEKVQNDREYLAQAKAVNENVNTLLKMNQQKIDLFREVRKTQKD